MTISKEKNGESLVIRLKGRLDTLTAPSLEEEVKHSLNGITELIFDFENLEYVSSAGLRILLSAYKIMRNQGTMKIVKANDIIQEVFEVTGLTDLFHNINL